MAASQPSTSASAMQGLPSMPSRGASSASWPAAPFLRPPGRTLDASLPLHPPPALAATRHLCQLSLGLWSPLLPLSLSPDGLRGGKLPLPLATCLAFGLLVETETLEDSFLVVFWFPGLSWARPNSCARHSVILVVLPDQKLRLAACLEAFLTPPPPLRMTLPPSGPGPALPMLPSLCPFPFAALFSSIFGSESQPDGDRLIDIPPVAHEAAAFARGALQDSDLTGRRLWPLVASSLHAAFLAGVSGSACIAVVTWVASPFPFRRRNGFGPHCRHPLGRVPPRAGPPAPLVGQPRRQDSGWLASRLG